MKDRNLFAISEVLLQVIFYSVSLSEFGENTINFDYIMFYRTRLDTVAYWPSLSFYKTRRYQIRVPSFR